MRPGKVDVGAWVRGQGWAGAGALAVCVEGGGREEDPRRRPQTCSTVQLWEAM